MRSTTALGLARKAAMAAVVGLSLASFSSAGAALGDEDDPQAFTIRYQNGLRFESNDGQYKIRLGGRIQADFASIHPSSLLNWAEPFGAGEGVEIRRARLYMSGELFDRVIFKAQYDFADEPTSLKDVYIGMKGLGPLGTVRLGHVKEPFGLEELNSSKYITFMERALGSVFDSARNFGLVANNHHLDQRLTWGLGIFAPTDDQGDFFSNKTQFDVTGRITGLPIYADNGRKLLHLGAAMSFQYARDVNSRFRQRPESHLAQYYLDTGIFQRDSQTLLGLELALVCGPFSLQAEHTEAWVNRPPAETQPAVPVPTANVRASYIQLSYFLTGEHRAYDTRQGVFSRVTPKKSFDPANGGWGAWQIAARYSSIDLRDSGLNGGVERNVTLGLNWHLFSNTRLQMNYVFADVDDTGDRLLGLITNASGHIHILQLRAQLEF